MRLLAVETATSRQSVALLEDGRVLASSDMDAAGAQAKWLVPTIDRLLKSVALRLSDLNGLAVSIGPGSFTGLRVGLATMMGFRMVAGLPLVAVPTLEGMAWNLRGAKSPLCPMLKARSGEVYWGLYQWASAESLQLLVEERVGPLEALASSLQEPILVLGEGWMLNRLELRRLLGPRMRAVREAPPEAMTASAVSVGLAGLERLRRGMVAGLGLTPRYVQHAEAELLWQAKHL